MDIWSAAKVFQPSAAGEKINRFVSARAANKIPQENNLMRNADVTINKKKYSADKEGKIDSLHLTYDFCQRFVLFVSRLTENLCKFPKKNHRRKHFSLKTIQLSMQ